MGAAEPAAVSEPHLGWAILRFLARALLWSWNAFWFFILGLGPAAACESQEPGCEQEGIQVVLISLAFMGLGFLLLFVMDRVRYGRVGLKPIVNVKLGVNLVCLSVFVAMATQTMTFSSGRFSVLFWFWLLANGILGMALLVLRWRPSLRPPWRRTST